MIYFLICLIIIILCHEGAHLLVAKKNKCKVEIVSIGFWKPIYRKKYKETTYQITPILLGGYVKLKDELKYSRSPYAFTNLPYRKKVFIALAGVTTNIIIGLIAIHLGIVSEIEKLTYFGFLSFILGITNSIPFPPLDGSYIFLVWLEKLYGKKRGYKLMEIICKLGFIFLITLQLICIPWIIKIIRQGAI